MGNNWVGKDRSGWIRTFSWRASAANSTTALPELSYNSYSILRWFNLVIADYHLKRFADRVHISHIRMHLSLLELFLWKRYVVSALICASLVLCLGGRPFFSIVFNYLLEADEDLQQIKLFRTDWHVLEAFAPDTKRFAVGPSRTTKRTYNTSRSRHSFNGRNKRDPETADAPPSPEASITADEDYPSKRILDGLAEEATDLCGWAGAECIKAEITPVASWTHADIGLVNSMRRLLNLKLSS